MPDPPFIVDAHLDLAYNALRGRDVFCGAREQTAGEGEEIPTVGLPDLLAGNVRLICATVFCMPDRPGKPGYRDAQQAWEVANAQLDWYASAARIGRLSLLRCASEIPGKTGEKQPPAAILLLEGADAIRTPDDVPALFDAGVRIVGLAWGQTRYAGGTNAPGPLTPAGVELIPHLDRAGLIHDTSHLADASFRTLLELTRVPVMASHSNCRAIVPTDRQLSDEMIRAMVARDGVIGINFYDRFLLPPDEYGKRRANLKDVVRHIDHVCELAGDAKHVAIGTDMDGGLGRDEIPEEIITAADLPKVAGALRDAGYDAESVAGIMGGNWVRFFARALPPLDDRPASGDC